MINNINTLKDWYKNIGGIECDVTKPNTDRARAVLEAAREGKTIWTQSSELIKWKGAVEYCQNQSGRLQTLDEAGQYRCENNGDDFSDMYQHTSTLIGYINDGKTGLRAFVFEPSLEQLLELTKHPQIDENYLQIPITDALAKQIIKDAKNRTFKVSVGVLGLSVIANKQGESEYSTNEIMKMLMPGYAKDNAQHIANKGYEAGYAWFDYNQPDKDNMKVRSVGLGGFVYGGVVADGGFGSGGRVRGVQQNR